MSVLILISDYDSYREICISACYHAFSSSSIRETIDTCMRRLDLPPSRAELYLSEASDTRLASLVAGIGIKLQTTASDSEKENLAQMYEARGAVPFSQLQILLERYGRLAYSFRKQDRLQA